MAATSPKRSLGHTGHRWRKLRAQVLRESTVCWICGLPGSTTVDHVVPVSLDERRALDRTNVRPAHLSCNASRGNGRRGLPTSRPW